MTAWSKPHRLLLPCTGERERLALKLTAKAGSLLPLSLGGPCFQPFTQCAGLHTCLVDAWPVLALGSEAVVRAERLCDQRPNPTQRLSPPCRVDTISFRVLLACALLPFVFPLVCVDCRDFRGPQIDWSEGCLAASCGPRRKGRIVWTPLVSINPTGRNRSTPTPRPLPSCHTYPHNRTRDSSSAFPSFTRAPRKGVLCHAAGGGEREGRWSRGLNLLGSTDNPWSAGPRRSKGRSYSSEASR